MARRSFQVLRLLCSLFAAFIVVFDSASTFELKAGETNFTESWTQFVEDGSMPGAVLIVATPKEIVSTECVGWADVESKTPMKDDSMFWIASNTKAVVAVAVMICVEEGLLDLDEPVENYLPELKNLTVERKQEDGTIVLFPEKSKVTLRQALSHTAGFRFLTRFQERYGIDALPVQRLMTVVGMTPLIDDPGARYSYSNLGIDVGQAAVEAVSGMTFEEFLQKRVFDPLEMEDTTFYPNKEQLDRMATPYCWDGDSQLLKAMRFQQMPSMDDGSPRFAEGGGGLFSSARDYIKFYQMLGGKGVGANGKRILSEKSVETMSTKQTGDSVETLYGFGLVVNDSWFGHGGAYGTQGVAYRDGSVVAVYMVAVGGLPKQGEAERVFRSCVDAAAKKSKENN
ncbi:MAG: beta-lactamase family protein [Thermoguttaceae bacterium]|nr:beta-lactamase family protein [Thermoguttaceae bacterium]